MGHKSRLTSSMAPNRRFLRLNPSSALRSECNHSTATPITGRRPSDGIPTPFAIVPPDQPAATNGTKNTLSPVDTRDPSGNAGNGAATRHSIAPKAACRPPQARYGSLTRVPLPPRTNPRWAGRSRDPQPTQPRVTKSVAPTGKAFVTTPGAWPNYLAIGSTIFCSSPASGHAEHFLLISLIVKLCFILSA